MYAQSFAPVTYQAIATLVLQVGMLGPMPSYSQTSVPPSAPMLANARLARDGIAQDSVAAPAASQQMLN